MAAKIKYKIIEIKRLSHFENDYHDFNLTDDDLKTVGIEIVHHPLADKEGNILILHFSCFFFAKNDKEKKLFGLNTLIKYQIMDMSEHFTFKEDSSLEIPTDLMQIFLSVSLSTIRGMFAVLNANPVYQKMILPEIDPIKLLTAVKEHQTREE
jgi:hypothetical protein